MTSLVFFGMAASFNAVMDTTADHYSSSIFKDKNPNFWNKSESWKGKKLLGVEVIDAWHVSKALMLISLYGSIITYKPIVTNFDNNLFNIGCDGLIYAAVWGACFEGLYSHLLKAK